MLEPEYACLKTDEDEKPTEKEPSSQYHRQCVLSALLPFWTQEDSTNAAAAAGHSRSQGSKEDLCLPCNFVLLRVNSSISSSHVQKTRFCSVRRTESWVNTHHSVTSMVRNTIPSLSGLLARARSKAHLCPRGLATTCNTSGVRNIVACVHRSLQKILFENSLQINWDYVFYLQRRRRQHPGDSRPKDSQTIAHTPTSANLAVILLHSLIWKRTIYHVNKEILLSIPVPSLFTLCVELVTE